MQYLCDIDRIHEKHEQVFELRVYRNIIDNKFFAVTTNEDIPDSGKIMAEAIKGAMLRSQMWHFHQGQDIGR